MAIFMAGGGVWRHSFSDPTKPPQAGQVPVPRPLDDTIFACATAPGRAGIAIIRISGPRARGILELFDVAPPPARRLSLATFRDPRMGDVIDRGMVAWFDAPQTYTGEDLCEFHVHGGSAVLSAITESSGASARISRGGARRIHPPCLRERKTGSDRGGGRRRPRRRRNDGPAASGPAPARRRVGRSLQVLAQTAAAGPGAAGGVDRLPGRGSAGHGQIRRLGRDHRS